MSVSEPRVCPHCGSDTYFAQNFPRLVQKTAALEDQVRRMAAQHGVERANWQLEKIERANERTWLAQKAHKQRLVINKLEAKLRKLGKVPHAEDS